MASRMSDNPPPLRVAVVGFGPRGLGAVEALILDAIKAGRLLHFHLFDPVEWPGAGPNFSPAQTPHCILNLPTRAIEIAPEAGLGLDIGNFGDWLPAGSDPDHFPTRARLGDYLSERFGQLVERTSGTAMFEVTHATVTDAVDTPDGWQLHARGEVFGPFDEVLLTQGQPATAPDLQLSRWRDHAEQSKGDLVSAYPDTWLLQMAEKWRGRTVAIRGLGLSTFDVLRVLTVGLGGTFSDSAYVPSGQEPRRILPFSLNGQPPLPKPIDAALDDRFAPTKAETDHFCQALRSAMDSEPAEALQRLSGTLLDPILRVMKSFDAPVPRQEVQSWLSSECEDPGALETREPDDALRANIEIARGNAAPSIEYAAGQIWRKWQDDLRRIFGENAVPGGAAGAINGFDEGLKRISYGPPLRSAEELLLLIQAGRVSLSKADDPEIVLSGEGWQLRGDDAQTSVSAMVDAVLPSPTLDGLTDPLMVSLGDRRSIQPAGEGLGVKTQPDGQVIDTSGKTQDGLSMLGRITLGSTIAVDSIHDCFGETPRRWAAGVMARHDA